MTSDLTLVLSFCDTKRRLAEKAKQVATSEASQQMYLAEILVYSEVIDYIKKLQDKGLGWRE